MATYQDRIEKQHRANEHPPCWIIGKLTTGADYGICCARKYTPAGLTGFAKNPKEDRKAVIAAMMEKAGGNMTGLWLTRSEYDAVVIGEAPDFETVAAIKMMVLASGAMNEMVMPRGGRLQRYW